MRQGVMRFGLLGPPVLYQPCEACGPQGAVRAIRSPKARALLAALLLEADRVVPVDSLKDALWGDTPPASAHASLHNHVTRLRRLLDDPDRLRAVPPGYRLRVEPDELDVHVFERHVAAARTAHTAGDWERVVPEAAAALALWRGAPLSGLPAELGGYAFVQRLAEARLLLLEWRYDAELAVGGARLGELVPELAELAAEYPLREAYQRQLMLALHRTGRRAEALAVHRDLRARLVEELGVEPGTAVREAHLEVLRGVPLDGAGDGSRDTARGGSRDGARDGSRDASSGAATGVSAGLSVGAPAGVAPGAAGNGAEDGARGEVRKDTREGTRGDAHGASRDGGREVARDGSRDISRDGVHEEPAAASAAVPAAQRAPRPAQLPPPPPHFTGRGAVHDDLRRALSEPGGVAVVSGMAGVGKSALALHVAHTLAERFADGQLYVNLHGATPGMTPLTSAQALAALLRDLGTEPRRIPEHPDAAAALLRSLLAPTRTLLVLDDAAHAAQVRPLLPGGPGCAVIVTSRSPLTALDGARRFPLAPLTGEDSAALLRAVSGRHGLHAAHPLVELTGRLPLALRVVAARLAARSALTPDVLAGQLAATSGRLHHLEYDDLSVRRSLAVAHDALAASDREADRDAARTLRHIGALDLPAYGAPLLAHLTGTDERRTEAALDRLVDVALLEETAYGRYEPHDLVRDFARELAEEELGAAGAAGRGPGAGRLVAPGPVPGADPGDPGRLPADATTYLADGWAAAAAATTSAGPTGPEADRTGPEADPTGLEADRTGPEAGPTGLEADRTRPEADPTGPEADRTRPEAGPTAPEAGRTGPKADRTSPEAGPEVTPVSAPDPIETALHWYAAVAERALTAIVEPGLDLDDRRRPTTAQPAGHAARVAAVSPFASAEEAFAWGDLELPNIVALVERCAADPAGGARKAASVSTLIRLLFPYLQRGGRLAEMEILGGAALHAARRLGDAPAEAYALGDLAGLRFLTGRQGEALALNDRALGIWRRLGVVSWIRRCLNNRGLLLEGLGRHAESEDALRQSLTYSRQLSDPHGEAVTYSHLGNLYEHTDPRAAIEQHRRSLAIGVTIGAVIVQHSAHCNIGYAHLTLGEPAAAARHFEKSLRILGGHGDWHGESQTRLGLVRALRQLGHTARAARECAELLRRADARADHYTGGLARHQQGLLLRTQGLVQQAYAEWRTALAALDGTDETAVTAELRQLLAQAAARC
ncbi:BTAD domain-containing putative transcriptional regulator [Streptomyces sp. NPDC001595]|uniref:BTAD domain-containing putative transcriptional regulator n=1 Tax=Streptomyces sp. NPDC001532 TaxID=3154520 RepID=UPI003328F1BA